MVANSHWILGIWTRQNDLYPASLRALNQEALSISHSKYVEGDILNVNVRLSIFESIVYWRYIEQFLLAIGCCKQFVILNLLPGIGLLNSQLVIENSDPWPINRWFILVFSSSSRHWYWHIGISNGQLSIVSNWQLGNWQIVGCSVGAPSHLLLPPSTQCMYLHTCTFTLVTNTSICTLAY